jgi:hypothetical protein
MLSVMDAHRARRRPSGASEIVLAEGQARAVELLSAEVPRDAVTRR